jgi:hypothetical protein
MDVERCDLLTKRRLDVSGEGGGIQERMDGEPVTSRAKGRGERSISSALEDGGRG